MSRHLLDIGPRMRNQSAGFSLVETRPNMQELRRHEVFLTPKGRALAERILRFWRHGSHKGGSAMEPYVLFALMTIRGVLSSWSGSDLDCGVLVRGKL
jgi:DNA-binding MarR family transcriptional regulator